MNKVMNYAVIVFAVLLIFLFLEAPFSIAQEEGVWEGVSDDGGAINFLVSNNEVRAFSIFLYFSGSGWIQNVIVSPIPISGEGFSFNNGLFEVNGTFPTN